MRAHWETILEMLAYAAIYALIRSILQGCDINPTPAEEARID
jgi:hypothetical protein